MSGHSKWASIKRKKGAADAKRGQAFTKLANAIAVAAKEGEDPALNYKLRIAIDQAKGINMPNANIEKSIARGSGKLGGAQIQEVIYEGYGPAGAAIIVKCATDNKNRTLPDVRTVFTKNGGRMAEAGSVMFQFRQLGVIEVEGSESEAASLAAIDAGAEDVEQSEDLLVIYTKPQDLFSISSKLETAGYKPNSAVLSYVPNNIMKINDADVATKAINLVEGLEELDDVTDTYSNFDLEPEILKNIQ